MDAGSQWTGLDSERLKRIGDHLERHYIVPGKIAGCQIAVARHGHLAYFKSFGLMDRERGLVTADDAIWRIYSMTMPITSVALMTLYEQGHFQLNDPVYRYAPSWRGHSVLKAFQGDEMLTEDLTRPITFRDLMMHTAGLTYGGMLPTIGDEHPIDPHYRSLGIRAPDSTDSMEIFLDKLGQVPLIYQPGTQWMYSVATDACGALVELISGRPFATYLREEIFEPLSMRDTGFQVPKGQPPRFAANYYRDEGKVLALYDDPQASKYLEPPGFVSGGSGLVGTTADYLRFCEMLRRGGELDGQRILGPRTLEMMHMNHLPGGGDLTVLALGAFGEGTYDGVGFGLGFAATLGQVATGTLGAGDYFWSGAASTHFWVDPSEDLCVVFMTQFIPSTIFNFRGQLKSLIYASIID